MVIVGGTGFIGQALCTYFAEQNTPVSIISRQLPKYPIKGVTQLSYEKAFKTEGVFENAVVINLAGASITGYLWTHRYKDTLLNSRVHTTRKLVDHFKTLKQPPQCLINASAVGIYDVTPGHDFLAKVCQAWEAQAQKAEALDIPTYRLRLGIVLGLEGGLLKLFYSFFKLGLGFYPGPGTQGFSWIALEDVCRSIDFLIQKSPPSGAFTLTAPNPTNMNDFTKLFAQTYDFKRRMAIPEKLLRAFVGETADAMCRGVHVYPNELLSLGYEFKCPTLDQALGGRSSEM